MPNKRHIMIDAITRIIERTSKKSEEQMDVEIDICTYTHLSKVLPTKESLENLCHQEIQNSWRKRIV